MLSLFLSDISAQLSRLGAPHRPFCAPRRSAQATHGVLCALLLSVLPSAAVAADSDWLLARDAFRAGDDQALQQAAVALNGSVLAVYADFWQIWRHLKDAPASDVRPFLAREQGTYLADKLRAEWLRQLTKKSDWVLFREEYPKLVDKTDVDLQCSNLQAELAAGNSANLAAAKANLWLTAKDQPATCTPVLNAMQANGVVTEEDRWRRLRLALDANAGGLARFLLQGLGAEVSANQLKSLQDAPSTYINQADLSQRAQRELVAYSYGRWARQAPDEANAKLISQADALREQAPLAWRQMALAAARRFDSDSDALFARSEAAEWTDSQRETRLRLLVRNGLWADYLRVYEHLPANLKDNRGWQFWQARATHEAGDEDSARRLFTRLSSDEDYYGLLAIERLGHALPPLPQRIELLAPDREKLMQNPGFKRAFALYKLGQRWESVSEFNWALRSNDDRQLLAAAEAANNLGWYDRAIYAAERTKSLNESRFRYLAPYREIAGVYVQEMKLDEAWVYGLMRQESRFVSNIRSGVGAGGLMQLMPTTAQWVSNRLAIAYHPDMINDVGQNVRLGTYYLSYVLAELGSPVLATAGYNAGPRRAREWQPDSDLEAARYIESIPFNETRDYVKKVMTNAVHYARAFGQGETRLSVRLGTIAGRNVTPIEGP